VHDSMPRTIAETAEMVRSIGSALGREQRGAEIAGDIERRAARVREEAQGTRPVRFAYLIWRKPWMSVNADTFAHALLAQAGGENVFGARRERYPEITAEELAAARPDLVLLSTEPFPFQAKHAEELAGLSGFSRERFQVADGELLSWHGSRTPAGIDYAAELIERARENVGKRRG